MKNKMFIIGIIVFLVGITMILGTSYSLMNNSLLSNESYGFNVANFNVSFSDNTKLTLSGIPMSDEEAIISSKEYTFNIDNNSDYDINYRLDIMDNSSSNMSEVIHYVYSINDSKYSDIITLKNNYTIKQNKVLKPNASDVYKLKIWLSDEADETYMNKSFSASILLNATQNEYKYATTVIEKLASNNQDGLTKVNNGYRYSLKDSSNYVWFNCKNGFTKGNDYCEKWRIIGSFNNKSEKSIDEYPSLKIVSTKAFESVPYNSLENNNYNESYINSYANGFYYDKLDSDTQKLILKARWNIGEVSSINYQDAIKEEEKEVYYAYIGLVNVSDYLYLEKESFINNENNILLNKTNNNVNILNNNSIVGGDNEANYNFVPCLYLRGDVSIISGDGKFENPYEFKIKYPLNY